MCVNFVHATNAADHYATPPTVCSARVVCGAQRRHCRAVNHHHRAGRGGQRARVPSVRAPPTPPPALPGVRQAERRRQQQRRQLRDDDGGARLAATRAPAGDPRHTAGNRVITAHAHTHTLLSGRLFR